MRHNPYPDLRRAVSARARALAAGALLLVGGVGALWPRSAFADDAGAGSIAPPLLTDSAAVTVPAGQAPPRPAPLGASDAAVCRTPAEWRLWTPLDVARGTVLLRPEFEPEPEPPAEDPKDGEEGAKNAKDGQALKDAKAVDAKAVDANASSPAAAPEATKPPSPPERLYLPLPVDLALRLDAADATLAKPVRFGCEVPVRDWSGHRRLELVLAAPAANQGPLDVALGFTGLDMESYDSREHWTLAPGSAVTLNLDLGGDTADWAPGPANKANWDAYTSMFVRNLRVFLSGQAGDRLDVAGLALRGRVDAPEPSRAARLLQLPVSPQRGDVVELRFSLDQPIATPFTPTRQSMPTVFVTGPDGKSRSIGAYFTRNYRLVTDPEHPEPVGRWYWGARFYARQAGDYTWKVCLGGKVLQQGDGSTARYTTTVADEGVAHGFLQLPTGNTGALEFEDGTNFYPIGFNFCWPWDKQAGMTDDLPRDRELSVYDEAYAVFAANGINTSQIWMTPFWTGLEWRRDFNGYGGPGIYSPAAAWKLDYVLKAARRNGIHLLLTVKDHHQYWVDTTNVSHWPANPWQVANGGPLKEPKELYTNEADQQGYRDYLAYVIARWGEDPNILAFDLLSETDNSYAGKAMESGRIDSKTFADQTMREEAVTINAWLDRFLPIIGRQVPGRWSVVGNCRQFETVGNQVFAHEGLPAVLTDAYAWRNSAYSTSMIQEMHGNWNLLQMHKKPMLFTETGFSGGGEHVHEMRAAIHCTYWGSSMMPTVGPAMYWWWNQALQAGLIPLVKPVASFWAGEDRRAQNIAKRSHHCLNVRHYPPHEAPDPPLGEFALRREANALTGPDPLWCYVLKGRTRVYGIAFPKHDTRYFMDGPPPIDDAVVTLDWVPSGNSQLVVEFWDTWTGQILERRRIMHIGSGACPLQLPPFRTDIAFKVWRAGTVAGSPDTAVPGEEALPPTALPPLTGPRSSLRLAVSAADKDHPPLTVAALADYVAADERTYYGSARWPMVDDRFNPFLEPTKGETLVAEYTGILTAPVDGDYGFATDSDDASFLWLDDELVVEWPDAHDPEHKDGVGSNWEHTASRTLTAGPHRFRYVVVNNAGGIVARAGWKLPETDSYTVIPASAFLLPDE